MQNSKFSFLADALLEMRTNLYNLKMQFYEFCRHPIKTLFSFLQTLFKQIVSFCNEVRLGFLDNIKGPFNLLFHPVNTIKDLFKMICSPIETFANIAKFIWFNPVRFVTNVVLSSLEGRLISGLLEMANLVRTAEYLAKATCPPILSNVTLPMNWDWSQVYQPARVANSVSTGASHISNAVCNTGSCALPGTAAQASSLPLACASGSCTITAAGASSNVGALAGSSAAGVTSQAEGRHKHRRHRSKSPRSKVVNKQENLPEKNPAESQTQRPITP